MKITAFLLGVLLLSGCAGYHLGPVKPTAMKGVETLAVPVFKNDTLAPRIEVLVADGIIKQLQQDGTYRIGTEKNADAVLNGTIAAIKRRPARSLRSNTWVTEEFELELTLAYKVVSRATGETLMSGAVIGRTSYFVGGDIQQNERQAIPLAIEDAAIRLSSHISEGW